MAVVETERHGQILVVRMNRPERLNALSHEMLPFRLVRGRAAVSVPLPVPGNVFGLAFSSDRSKLAVSIANDPVPKSSPIWRIGSMPWAQKPRRARHPGSKYPSFSFRPIMSSMAAVSEPIARTTGRCSCVPGRRALRCSKNRMGHRRQQAVT